LQPKNFVLKKEQVILLAGAALLVIALFVFGRTVPAKQLNTPKASDEHAGHNHAAAFDIAQFVDTVARPQLEKTLQDELLGLEKKLETNPNEVAKALISRQIADFWQKKATKNNLLPFAWWNGRAAKLEKSEKSLTFAARYFLEKLEGAPAPEVRNWMAAESKSLFEQALSINPGNDSNKVGLGACYIFGGIGGEPQETMQGIQTILEVARRDSLNMYAQFMLGVGGVVSGQLDKAASRFKTVVQREPGNVEAIFRLADVYEQLGKKDSAILWYKTSLKQVEMPDFRNAIEKRIEELQMK
jgi:tetratricopeptide (TPR) repeat protein